jgi:hypothetical protein
MTHNEVTEFISEHIMHIFGIPHTLTMNQGMSLYPKRYEILQNYIRSDCSIHFCTMIEGNVQLESSNTTSVKLIKKKIDGYLSRWHGLTSDDCKENGPWAIWLSDFGV